MLFGKLLPREGNFFEVFNQHGLHIVEGARAFVAPFLATGLGIQVSTTHTITGASVGVGSTRSASNVRWGVAAKVIWAWIFTVPASALIAALGYGLGRLGLAA